MNPRHQHNNALSKVCIGHNLILNLMYRTGNLGARLLHLLLKEMVSLYMATIVLTFAPAVQGPVACATTLEARVSLAVETTKPPPASSSVPAKTFTLQLKFLHVQLK